MLADRRARLRAATDVMHRRLDAHVEKGGFLDSIAGYRDYLGRTLRVRRAMEGILDVSGAASLYPAWPGRRIAHAVASDLADLGGVDETESVLETGRLGRGGVLGALYVLEGSSIGARLIARRVAALGAAAERGARHLDLQAADTKAFQAFLVILENTRLESGEETECMASAIDTFTRFEHAYTA